VIHLCKINSLFFGITHSTNFTVGSGEEKGSRGDWITKGRKGWLPQPGRLWLAGS